jgi:hypothetical protein
MMTTIHHKLRMLRCLTDGVHRDLKNYLESPENYNAAEYFSDVADTALEAILIIDEVRKEYRESVIVKLGELSWEPSTA